MDYKLPALRRDERLALRLRALYEENGFRLLRTGSFEEYDLYMQNKPFLMGDDVISFTAADGRLLALKPDVTLSIVKNTSDGKTRRVYYQENVFRRSRHSGEYRQINQMGLEFIGGEGMDADKEVLVLALKSLAVLGDAILDLSHIGVLEAIQGLFAKEIHAEQARCALRDKSPHAMRAAAGRAGLQAGVAESLVQLCALSGPFEETIGRAKQLSGHIPALAGPLEELEDCFAAAACAAGKVVIRLDFSIINDVDYYNGIIFQGYESASVGPVLAGGRYDNLMRRFDKTQGALGFALYLDMLGQAQEEAPAGQPDAGMPWLNIALPKGRLGTKTYNILDSIGFSCNEMNEDSRKLVFEDTGNRVRYFMVKPTDVDKYVEHGVADIGVVGKDVLLESDADVLELLDLGFGRCRLSVAAVNGYVEDEARVLRVATKYPRFARSYYASQSRSVEIIELHGSMELAPLIGLADVIVDIVETGTTLKENNLSVITDIVQSSARMIVNRAAWRFKEARIRQVVDSMRDMV